MDQAAFGGVNPQSTTFPVSVLINVDMGVAYDYYDGPLNWHLLTGSDVVKLEPPDVGLYTYVNTIAAAPPNSPNDVTIELGIISTDVFSHHIDMRTPPISLSVLEPYQTQKPTSPVDYCVSYQGSPYGYDCYIYYQTLDQNGKILPSGSLPINENFLTQPISYQPNNWVQGSACGSQHQCSGAPMPIWADRIAFAGPPLSTGPGTCTAPLCIPQPTAPISPIIPRAGVGVDYWLGEWRLGSNTPGMGIRIQTNNWTEYVDHGQHENVVSPAPD